VAEVDVFYGDVVVALPELAFLMLCRVPLTSQGRVILGWLRRRKDLRMPIGRLILPVQDRHPPTIWLDAGHGTVEHVEVETE